MPKIVSLSKSAQHSFSKTTCKSLTLIEGEGVEDDAHRGTLVKHRSRVKASPTAPNLRQVHLIHYELIAQLQKSGFDIQAATMGENITTEGIDLLSLPRGTQLEIGENALIQITGLRNPCKQLDNYQQGLTAAVLAKDNKGNLIRKAGIMGIVLRGADISVGDSIKVILPPEPYHPLLPV